MKKFILAVTLATTGLFAFNPSFGMSATGFANSGTPQQVKMNRIQMMKSLYKLKMEAELKQLQVQQQILDNKIKMLKKELNFLTQMNKKEVKQSVRGYISDPKVIVKKINFTEIRNEPIYMGILTYLQGEKIIGQHQGKQKILFSSFSSPVPMR